MNDEADLTLRSNDSLFVLPPQRRRSMEGQLFESHILAISGANAVNSPSVPALGLFSQPIDGQPLPSLNLDALGDIGPPNDEDSLGLPLGTLAPGAKWDTSYALPNVLIRTPLDAVHQPMVPCTPGPAQASQPCVETALGHQFSGFPMSNDGNMYDKAAQAYLFGSSDEDAVSGEVQLNHVADHDHLHTHDPFLEGSSPSMIHSASKTAKKSKKKKKAVQNKKARTAQRVEKRAALEALAAEGIQAAGGADRKTAKKLEVTGDMPSKAFAEEAKTPQSTKATAKAFDGKATRVTKTTKVTKVTKSSARKKSVSIMDLDELSSQDLKTPVASQQSTGSQSHKSSAKKSSAKKRTLAGRPVNTPIVKKIKNAEAKTKGSRRPHAPWVLDTVRNPRTGKDLAPGQVPPAEWCTQCSVTTTPVWRAGPFGHKTLCNACGVRWMKQLPKRS